MLDGQLDLVDLLPAPRGTSPLGRDVLKKRWAKKSKERAKKEAERSKAKRAAMTPEQKEEYRRRRKAWDAARYARDPEKVRQASIRTYRRNFAGRSKYAAERYRRRLVTGMLYRAEKRAFEKGWAFNLTVDDIVIPTHCPVLGIPIEVGKRATGGILDNAPSLDRFDNTKGYISGNVRVISHRANAIKRDATLAEMEAVLAYMRGEL